MGTLKRVVFAAALAVATAGPSLACIAQPEHKWSAIDAALPRAEISDTDRVLIVGCATGYSAAVIQHLTGAVVALEQDPGLAQLAKDNLQALGASNTTVVTGPLVGGWPAAAPYEVILLDGAVEDVPQTLLRQLKDGGRLLGVVGRPPLSKAMLFRSTGVESSSRLIFDATAPALPGFAKPAAFVF